MPGSDTKAVGIIGLGNMGRGIASNYIKAGYEVHVWDALEEARKPFEGKASLTKPQIMAAKCQMIIFVVPGSAQIDDLMSGEASMLNLARSDLVLYDFTTSDPTYTKELAERAGQAGIVYLDAGMTGGGAKGADEGTLTLMIGGDETVYHWTVPLLQPCAKKLIYLGPSGAGHTMKLVHNMITHTNFFALCEAAHLARRAGIELSDMIEVFNNGNARSFVSERRFPDHILSETFDGRSHVFNLNKDVGMAIKLADDLGANVNIGRDTFAYIQSAIEMGLEDEDFTRLYPIFDDLKGRDI